MRVLSFTRHLILLYVAVSLGCASPPEWKRRAALLDARFPRPKKSGPRCLTDEKLAQGLIAAVHSVDFSEVWDYGPLYGVGCPADPEKHPICVQLVGPVEGKRFPQIDLSVVLWNDPACKDRLAKATVVFDRAHRDGFIAKYDDQTLQIRNIRFRKWDEARWNGGRYLPLDAPPPRGTAESATIEPGSEVAWNAPFADDTLLNVEAARATKRDEPSVDFMSPWPASSFKLMVATAILKLLDGVSLIKGPPVTLETPIFLPTQDLVGACPAMPRTLTLRQALETMLQWSGNCATAGLVRFLHAQQEIVQSPVVDAQGYPLERPSQNRLNDLLAGLGLSTLQMNRTIEASGRWGNPNDNYASKTASVANNHMTSWDAARLLWLFEDDVLPAALMPRWRVGAGAAAATVNLNFVSPKQKQLLRDILRDSYSGSLLVSNSSCARDASQKGEFGMSPEPGIPARLSNKWLDGNKVRDPVGDYPYPEVVDDVGGGGEDSAVEDLLPCQRIAEVEYLNKPGLTNVAGSSAGIVRGIARGALPHSFRRHYIVSFFSSLGTRYGDAARMKAAGLYRDARSSTGISTTQKIPLLGARLDAWLAMWLEKN